MGQPRSGWRWAPVAGFRGGGQRRLVGDLRKRDSDRGFNSGLA
jgi:hypothetical protein